jgi:hypothetical protein
VISLFQTASCKTPPFMARPRALKEEPDERNIEVATDHFTQPYLHPDASKGEDGLEVEHRGAFPRMGLSPFIVIPAFV